MNAKPIFYLFSFQMRDAVIMASRPRQHPIAILCPLILWEYKVYFYVKPMGIGYFFCQLSNEHINDKFIYYNVILCYKYELIWINMNDKY